jgi:general secretion pathway protein L
MSKPGLLLRIRISLHADASYCEWAMLGSDFIHASGSGALSDIPAHHGRTEVLLAAGDVLITQLPLPDNARHQQQSVLAYAVEDIASGDPQSNLVHWLGADAAGIHTLAVLDKADLQRWRSALAAVNVRLFDLRCETLQLPRTANHWSLAWTGANGFVRSADLSGWATDLGTDKVPPLALSLALSSITDVPPPSSVDVYCTAPGCQPDYLAWSALLGVPVVDAGDWDWRSPVAVPGPLLSAQRRRRDLLDGMLPRLRPALWVLSAALLIQSAALGIDQHLLSAEQDTLRAQMELRFRNVFPDAVAVINPALQMQRQLTRLRQLNGISDHTDFLPMLQQLAHATQQLPAGVFRTVSWDSGRMTVELAGIAQREVLLLQIQLQQAGLRVEVTPGEAVWVFVINPA